METILIIGGSLASLATFLLSGKSNFITGQIILADSGVGCVRVF
ncbi:MAG: hypothetical protein ACPG32_15480 [Akkermansiaceae bacterium]